MTDGFSISQGICKTFNQFFKPVLTVSISNYYHMDVLEYDWTRFIDHCCMPSNTTAAAWWVVSSGLLQIPPKLYHPTIEIILDAAESVLGIGEWEVRGSWQRVGRKFEFLPGWNIAAKCCPNGNECLPNEGRGSADYHNELEGYSSGSDWTSLVYTVDEGQSCEKHAK